MSVVGLLWLLLLIIIIVVTTWLTIYILHLKNKLAFFEISVLWHKGSRATSNAMSACCPSVCVEARTIEVLLPTHLEYVFTICIFALVVIGLDVLVASVPRHAFIAFKVLSAPIRRPEVHDDMVFLVDVIEGLIEIIVCMNFTSTFNAIDNERDVFRCPPDVILVPVI